MLDRSYAEKLKAVFHGGDAVDAGQLQFINLDDVRARSGPRWPLIRKRVFAASESFIEKRLGEAGVVIRAATGFIILCPAAEDGAVDAQVKRISDELLAFFLGDEFLASLNLGVTTRRVTMDEVKAVIAASHEAEPSSLIAPEPRAAPPAPAPAESAGHEILFKPLWAASTQTVALYFALPFRKRRDGVVLRGHDLLPHPVRPDDSLVLDLDALSRTCDRLNALIAAGGRCAVSTPAHFETLSSGRTRIDYLRELSALPASLRQFLVVRIEGAPADAPASRLQETCRLVRPHCGRLFIHTPMDADRLTRFGDSGVDAFGIAAPKSVEALEGRRYDFERFMIAADRLHARVYMDNCYDADVVEAAIACGVSYFSGPAIGAGRSDLGRPFRLPWSTIQGLEAPQAVVA